MRKNNDNGRKNKKTNKNILYYRQVRKQNKRENELGLHGMNEKKARKSHY
jgi:hypothetical protein